MAEKGPGSTSRTAKKRLARAKIKPTENGIKSSKGRQVQEEEQLSKRQQAKERKKKITAVAIGVFAVIMALSMMLPSLTYIFGNNDQPVQEEQEADQDAQTETEDSEETETLTGVDLVDSNYAAVVDPLEAKLAENPKDLATLLSLGNNYMSWASEASAYAADDAGTAHVNELYQQAIDYFDQYLKLNDSAVVKANRAMCLFYSGDADAALKALQKLTKEAPDYGPAWANIGLIREYQGDLDAAKEAYQKAIEADPNDEYGAKSYANRRLAAMAAQNGEGLTDETAESANGSGAGGAEALNDALGAGN